MQLEKDRTAMEVLDRLFMNDTRLNQSDALRVVHQCLQVRERSVLLQRGGEGGREGERHRRSLGYSTTPPLSAH
jgi:hypothetical protein